MDRIGAIGTGDSLGIRRIFQGRYCAGSLPGRYSLKGDFVAVFMQSRRHLFQSQAVGVAALAEKFAEGFVPKSLQGWHISRPVKKSRVSPVHIQTFVIIRLISLSLKGGEKSPSDDDGLRSGLISDFIRFFFLSESDFLSKTIYAKGDRIGQRADSEYPSPISNQQMTETSKLTNHAVQRARERLGLGAAECELVINTLWNRGRVPTPDDWRAFETVPMPGYAYRVTAFRARRVLIVQEVRGFTFVTLRIARTKQRRIL